MDYLDSKRSVLLQNDIQSFFIIGNGSEAAIAAPADKVEVRTAIVHLQNNSFSASSNRFRDAELEINQIWSDSGHEDEPGKTVSNVSRITAVKVLNSLPFDISIAPEVNSLPSGSITLDWQGVGGDLSLIISGQFVDLGVRYRNGRQTADRSRFEDALPADYISSLKKVIATR